jgi:hypothetical protein
MSVIMVLERSAGASAQADAQGKRSYTRHDRVIVDDVNDGPLTVGIDYRVPKAWDFYLAGNDIDIFARVKNIHVTKPGDDWQYYDVEVQYDNTMMELPDNPLMRPHIISVGKGVYQKVLWKSFGTPPAPILNSANCYFDPPIVVDDNRPTISIQRNEDDSIDPIDIASDYCNRTNSTTFLGLDVNTVLCTSISGTRQYENDIWYWSMTYEFQYRADDWNEAILDQGTMELAVDPADGKIKPSKIPDPINKGFVSEPVPLDANGKALWRTKPNPVPADFHFITYDLYDAVDFSPLNLP